LPNFGTVWHYHPEIELHYIIRGEGVRFVGDNISNFQAGELLLLGANLPHVWRCSNDYFQSNPNITAEAIVVHFLPDFAGNDLLEKPESLSIVNLFEKAKSGLEIFGETKAKIVSLMRNSVKKEGFGRLVTILNMVSLLSESTDMRPISMGFVGQHYNNEEKDRLNRIYHYTLDNYLQDITLEDIASIANLSVTSFCRYFKMMTKKTFHDFLIEIRISHAKQMLIDNMLVTTETVCFECGFNNRSNFFRHFKRITGCSPVEYKRKYLIMRR